MSTPGKAPLDNRSETSDDSRAERYAEIERRNGDKVGAKEMALTKNRRAEDDGRRAERFADIERRGES